VKRTAAAALRNRAAIADAVGPHLPSRGTVLELGSGTGEHAVLLAARFPSLAWQPSDPDPEARASIRAWSAEARLPNLLPPLDYDVRLELWRRRSFEAVLCVNVLHVAPPACTGALLAGSARVLAPGGPLFVYGPFRRGEAELGGRLARLERTLRSHDPALGVRDLDALVRAARAEGLLAVETVPMPEEGDHLVVFRLPAHATPEG
jgi:SAM-dependent methyltransferase